MGASEPSVEESEPTTVLPPRNRPACWPLLLAARRFTIEVAHRTGAVQQGAGIIEVRSPDPGHVVWRERGRWTAGSLAGIEFSNSTAWAIEGRILELSHLRRGEAAPVHLVRLVSTTDNAMVSQRPHQCGRDRYSARLAWESDRLSLHWTVASPTDPYELGLTVWGG